MQIFTMCIQAGDTIVNEKHSDPGSQEDAHMAFEHSMICVPSCLYSHWSGAVATCGNPKKLMTSGIE